MRMGRLLLALYYRRRIVCRDAPFAVGHRRDGAWRRMLSGWLFNLGRLRLPTQSVPERHQYPLVF